MTEKHVAMINAAWPLIRLKVLGTFEDSSEAEAVLHYHLNRVYGDQWVLEGEQWRHVNGGCGDAVVGVIHPESDVKSLRREINAVLIQAAIYFAVWALTLTAIPAIVVFVLHRTYPEVLNVWLSAFWAVMPTPWVRLGKRWLREKREWGL